MTTSKMKKRNKVVTLSQFIAEEQAKFPEASGNLSTIFRDIKFAAKMVNRDVNKAGLVDILGEHGSTNIQGESVKKLDVIANDEFINSLSVGGDCCAIISEEEDYVRHLNPDAKYIVAMDPLDGSSNIDVNAAIGTIFSVYKRVSAIGTEATEQDCLQKGVNQVAAGYVIYGSSTMLVYTTGNGVNGFTLDISIGDFCLSHPNMTTPETGTIYSVNEGNYNQFKEGFKTYINQCRDKSMSARYIGSMVADFHRNLIKGGIFMYPATTSAPKGKLRLNYECNPMAFLTEQAGGIATTGDTRIMEVEPTELHQRVPVIMGSRKMVEDLVSLLK